jgi:hypothetical protein
MPLERIDDDGRYAEKERSCINSEHNPPMHMVLEPGTYKYTCPSCGKVTTFEVPRITI